MRIVGDTVYIQRGEIWSLDFTVTDKKGRPFMPFLKWENPYVVITVTSSMYEQTGDMRETYWLDLSRRYVEQEDGSVVLEDVKRFIATEPLYLPDGFSVIDIMSYYGDKIVIDDTSDFDIKNYLFYTDPAGDGNYVYKYISSYTGNSISTMEPVWTDYSFRIVKYFNTKDWTEQRYFYGIKILAGQSLKEYVAGQLGIAVEDWTDDELKAKIQEIENVDFRELAQDSFERNIPLMPNYDTEIVIFEPTRILVGTNL